MKGKGRGDSLEKKVSYDTSGTHRIQREKGFIVSVVTLEKLKIDGKQLMGSVL